MLAAPDNESGREATHLSAINDVSARHVNDSAADGMGSPRVLDPLAGISPHPFFLRDLRFVSAMDCKGRVRLAAFTNQSTE